MDDRDVVRSCPGGRWVGFSVSSYTGLRSTVPYCTWTGLTEEGTSRYSVSGALAHERSDEGGGFLTHRRQVRERLRRATDAPVPLVLSHSLARSAVRLAMIRPSRVVRELRNVQQFVTTGADLLVTGARSADLQPTFGARRSLLPRDPLGDRI